MNEQSEEATQHYFQFYNPAEQVQAAIERLPECFERTQALARFGEMCYWFSQAHINAYDPEAPRREADTQ